ncbi:hypothetical protein LCGC14_0870410 [marine sediment metagenome]|uniref:Uncharacterized protein n=1 Tax=marine sediment metagenome TaxID=412755 RepID=A0A0F9P4Y0_9ZZZZ|nr:MAG: hypothetical protein Lokiarch_16390 [Candidatus Lokiarchaeum sp. GC14_75]
MKEKELTDKELEDRLDKAFKESESKKGVFKILRNEKESLDIKEKRTKKKFKF